VGVLRGFVCVWGGKPLVCGCQARPGDSPLAPEEATENSPREQPAEERLAVRPWVKVQVGEARGVA